MYSHLGNFPLNTGFNKNQNNFGPYSQFANSGHAECYFLIRMLRMPNFRLACIGIQPTTSPQLTTNMAAIACISHCDVTCKRSIPAQIALFRHSRCKKRYCKELTACCSISLLKENSSYFPLSVHLPTRKLAKQYLLNSPDN